MSILKKAVSAAGPLMRVLIGTGAIVLLIFGLKEKSGKRTGHADRGEQHSWRGRQRKRS